MTINHERFTTYKILPLSEEPQSTAILARLSGCTPLLRIQRGAYGRNGVHGLC